MPARLARKQKNSSDEFIPYSVQRCFWARRMEIDPDDFVCSECHEVSDLPYDVCVACGLPVCLQDQFRHERTCKFRPERNP